MSDSVDRVFAHALQTVRKIPRTGSARPPAEARLKLYGLYKQSMEGDVEGVMARPPSPPPPPPPPPADGSGLVGGGEGRAEVEKWDAWNAQRGLPRTEAKRRYIETLIETMHKYASSTPEARELVAELEFVWEQIRYNVAAPSLASPAAARSSDNENPTLGMVSPHPSSSSSSSSSSSFSSTPRSQPRAAADDPSRAKSHAHRKKWRASVEKALVKMTTEVTALREQLEAARATQARRRRGPAAWLLWALCVLARHLLVDALLGAALWVWLRRRGERRAVEAGKVLARAVEEAVWDVLSGERRAVVRRAR